MIHGQAQTSRTLHAPVSLSSNSTVTGVALDTLGYDYAIIEVALATEAAVTTNPKTITLCEGAVTTAGTAIAAFTGDGASGFTIPAVCTDGTGSIVRMCVDLTKRKRYLSVQISPAAVGALLYSVTAKLERRTHGAYSPTGPTDAELGCSEIVYG